MSRAGSSSDPPAGVRQSITGERPVYKSKCPPLSLILQRVGPPLQDPVATDDAADNNDQRMTRAEACNDEEDSDDDNDDNRKINKKKEPHLILEALDATNAEDISLNQGGGLKRASNAISTGGCGMERL